MALGFPNVLPDDPDASRRAPGPREAGVLGAGRCRTGEPRRSLGGGGGVVELMCP